MWEAVRAYTWNAAFATHEELKIGSLETGKKADFVVLDQNIIELGDILPMLILNTSVTSTFMDGKLVYSKP